MLVQRPSIHGLTMNLNIRWSYTGYFLSIQFGGLFDLLSYILNFCTKMNCKKYKIMPWQVLAFFIFEFIAYYFWTNIGQFFS